MHGEDSRHASSGAAPITLLSLGYRRRFVCRPKLGSTAQAIWRAGQPPSSVAHYRSLWKKTPQLIRCRSGVASAVASTDGKVVDVGAPTRVGLRGGEAGSQGEEGVGGPALGCMCSSGPMQENECADVSAAARTVRVARLPRNNWPRPRRPPQSLSSLLRASPPLRPSPHYYSSSGSSPLGGK